MAIRSPERAWARARVQPHIRAVERHGRWAPSSRRRRSPSSPAAGGRRSRAAAPSSPVTLLPAEEDVAGGLHQALAGDHPLRPGWRSALVPTNASSTDAWASLACRNSGSSLVAAEQQQDPRPGADAADPDDLAGHVDESELLEQMPAVGLQRPPVARSSRRAAASTVARSLLRRQQLLDRHDQRRVADDPPLAVDHVGQLGERLHAVPGPGLGHVAPRAACAAACRELRRELLERSSSTSMWAYQTSRLVIPANSRIAVAVRARPPPSTTVAPLAWPRTRCRGRRSRSWRPAA